MTLTNILAHPKKSSKVIKGKLPCPNPTCGSSDAFFLYDDHHGHCFSCGRHYNRRDIPSDYFDVDMDNLSRSTTSEVSVVTNLMTTKQYVEHRSLTLETLRKYEISTNTNAQGVPVSVNFPYGPYATLIRNWAEKEYHWSKTSNSPPIALFGMDKFSPNASKFITITEGQYDAAAVYQMLGSKYPVVSVNSASSAKKDCSNAMDYLNSFEKIYLCFDNDKAGEQAKKAVASLFPWDKIYDVKMTAYKDANEYLVAGKEKDFVNTWWAAKRIIPEEIVFTFEQIDVIISDDKQVASIPYPWEEMTKKTYGLRHGEFLLFTGMEGIGKTEVARRLEYHLLQNTDDNLGAIHLEETKLRQIKGLAGFHLQKPIHLPDHAVSPATLAQAYKEVVKRDERFHIYSHFGSSDPKVLLDTIRFLATARNCKWITLDHITQVVTGLEDADKTKTLDFLATSLEAMVKDLGFTLICLSHINDDGKTRDSRMVSKVADLWVQLDRNVEASDITERNTTQLRIRKNRFAGSTGPAGSLLFDPATYMLKTKPETPF